MTDRYDEHLREREAQNRYASTKLWSPRPHLVGMIGEKASAKEFGYEMDLRNRPDGDGGAEVEFLLRLPAGGERWFKINVKTNTYGDWLRVDINDIEYATIYIHATVRNNIGVCLGWELGRDLMKLPRKKWTAGNTVHAKNHLATPLRPISELKAMMVAWRHYDKSR